MTPLQKLAASIPLSPGGNGLRGEGPLGLEGVGAGATGTSVSVFNQVISATIGVVSAIAFIWFSVNVLLGAFSMLTAGADKNKVAEARKKITNNVLGVIIVVSAIFLASIIGQILGIDILGGANLIYQIAI